MLETKNPGAGAGAESVLVGSLRPDQPTEFSLQAQGLEAKLSLPPHLARCVLYLLRGDVW
jgi:hypothetical protein